MSGIPTAPLSDYRTLPEEHYGESLAFPVDEVAWNPYPYYGHHGYWGGYPDYNSYYYHMYRIDRQNKLDQYDEMLRNKSTTELQKIQDLREQISDMQKEAKVKQLEAEGELKSYQTMNKQLMNQMNMLRENEFLRERIAQREYDKIDKVTEKIQDKADSLARFKDHVHSHCSLPPYVPSPVYMTPRVETTKIIEKDSCCHSPCRKKCACEEECSCGDESYIYLLPPIHSSRKHIGSRNLRRSVKTKSVKPDILFEHL
ncbi:unnamed protein product [Moneuplotes crassus]|uniref:Uncharacterized protein n=2 Tax=Euplotes crassus TaxID=5936 RepID=A0AAD2D1S3_EUPCR|nr:unnamed protein product [Moneuplotes crassus]